jgi:hypothetical protein
MIVKNYFAILRNLRNILEAEVDDYHLNKVIKALSFEPAIRKSLVLPFRFTTALDEIEKTNLDGAKDVLVALNNAVDISLKNVPVFEGKTLVVLDQSGSMHGRPAQIGSLFAAVLVKSNNADLMTFSNDARYKTINPMDSIITIASSLRRATNGTNFHAIFKTANKVYQRIIILSDMQGWIGFMTPAAEFAEYKRKYNAEPFVYSFDLAGYGTLQLPQRNVYCLAGFSDKVFDVIKFLETDKEALMHEIEKIEL